MPNRADDVVGKPDMASAERDRALALATTIRASYASGLLAVDIEIGAITCAHLELLARAVQHYVPAGVPMAAPHAVAAPTDRTARVVTPAGIPLIPAKCPTCSSPDPKRHPAMQFEGEVQICRDPFHSLTPAGGLIGDPIEPEASDGTCEVSDDGSTTQHRNLGITGMFDLAVHGDITKR